MRVPTPPPKPIEPTPGPEALASMLEPTPSPETASQGPRAAPKTRHPGRSFLIGALIGFAIFGATVAVFVSKRQPTAGAPSAPAP